MNIINVHFNGTALALAAEIGKARVKARTIFPADIFKRIDEIILQQPIEKRAAFYDTTCEAGLWGADYGHCETIKDMGDVYARYLIEKVFCK